MKDKTIKVEGMEEAFKKSEQLRKELGLTKKQWRKRLKALAQ